MKQKTYIGIDLGGTTIKGGLVSAKGKIIEQLTLNTPSRKKTIIQRVERMVSQLISSSKECQGIGLSWPSSVNIPLKGSEMRRRLEKKIPLPVWVENDASCFALAESLIGAGKNYSVVLGITLGTGLGGGLVINQKIFKGKGGASELGHTILDFHGPKCECGNAGCLEQFVGKKGLARLAKQHHFATKEGAALYRLAQDGNKKALRIWQVLGSFLGIGLVNAINVYDPEIIVLGGGISQAGKFFKKAMESEIKRRSFLKPGLIKVSQLKKGGVIGAALLAKRSFDKSPN